ncbi:MAG: hypothetical protein DMF42_06580 [Verrucomicrobia bacterium]|nr:MAG: hypothetical protein DMF42_06580 [Verrucomicrobiota bacterium]
MMTDEQIAENCRQLMKEQGLWIESLEPDEREALEVFCDTVNELEEYPLYKKLLRENVVNSDISVRDGTVVRAAIRNLDENDLRAFVLTGRLFGQDNDRISIRKIAEIFDRRVGARELLWMNFNGYRQGWNQFRTHKIPELNDTMGSIFDVFLYGHYAHRDKTKATTIKEWRKTPDGFVARQSMFLIALGTFFWTVRGMREYVARLLSTPPHS